MSMKTNLAGVGHKSLAYRIQAAKTAEDQIEHADLCVLVALHDEFGFGAERLRRFYHAVVRTAVEYNKYNGWNEPKFGRREKRQDMYELRKRLLDIGFDYDAERTVDDDYGKKG